MAESDCAASLSTLISKEDETSFNANEMCEDAPMSEVDGELVELLLSRERCYSSSRAHDSSPQNSKALKSARSDAIRWILKAKAFFGFGVKTVYVAVSYLDGFFEHRTVDFVKGKSWAIRLLSVACLSLAAKMEECEVPALSEFETEEYRFRPAAIRRMELLVLSTLEWRMSVVTPFSYLNYFASWFQEHESKHLVRKAINLIFASIEGERDFVKMLNRALFLLKDSIFNAAMSLVDYRPSVIAAAAVLAVLDERLTQKSVESKMSTISSCSSLDTGHVFSCYCFMTQEVQKEMLHTAKCFHPNESAADCSSVDANGSISFVGESSKRRRLQ